MMDSDIKLILKTIKLLKTVSIKARINELTGLRLDTRGMLILYISGCIGVNGRLRQSFFADLVSFVYSGKYCLVSMLGYFYRSGILVHHQSKKLSGGYYHFTPFGLHVIETINKVLDSYDSELASLLNR